MEKKQTPKTDDKEVLSPVVKEKKEVVKEATKEAPKADVNADAKAEKEARRRRLLGYA